MVIVTKTCTIHAATIYTFLKRSIFQFMILHTKPWVTHTLKFPLHNGWMNTVHLINGWNCKGITY